MRLSTIILSAVLSLLPLSLSAKDPVILGGMIASNVIRGEIDCCLPSDIPALLADRNTVVLDVRTQEEWDEGHVEGAVLLPVDELRDRLAEIPLEKPVYVHCKSGQRSYIACRILAGMGYECYNLAGGYDRWSAVTQG